MPTRAGWAVVISGAILATAGRIVGAIELMIVGVAFMLLVTAAVITVAVTSPSLEVGRLLRPSRLHVGDTCTIDLRFTNVGHRRSPVIEATDAVGQAVTASVLLGPLAPQDTASVRYRIETERRGEMWVGPLAVSWSDPFTLARRRRQLSGHKRVVVLPAVWSVLPPLRARGGDDAPSQVRPDALGRTGDDLYALRRYVAGDDPRRIHWASSARHGDLMVRQAQHPTTSRSTVIVDDRSSWSEPDFDLAASIAASILLAAHRRGDETRLLTASGTDTGYGGGIDHLFAAFERLALLMPVPDGSLAGLPSARDLDRCSVVLVSPAASGASPLGKLLGDNPDVTRVLVATTDEDVGAAPDRRPGVSGSIVVSEERPFDLAWADAHRTAELSKSGA